MKNSKPPKLHQFDDINYDALIHHQADGDAYPLSTDTYPVPANNEPGNSSQQQESSNQHPVTTDSVLTYRRLSAIHH